MEQGSGTSGRIAGYIKRKAFRYELMTLLGGVLAGRIVLAEGVCPFGAAYLTSAAVAGCSVHYALAGVLAGSLLLAGRPQLEAGCACLLFYALHLLWKKLRPRAELQERFFLMFISQILCIPLFHGNGWAGLKTGLICLGAQLMGALTMQSAMRTLGTLEKRHVLSDLEQIAISAFAGLMIMSVSDVIAYGFSLTVTLLLAFAMVAALARGAAGVSVAVAIGAVLAAGGVLPLSLVGGLAACTLAGSAMRKLGAMGVFGGFVLCALFVGTYVFTAAHTINLINLSAAGAAFLIVPKECMLALCGYLDAEKNRERYARRAMKRLRERTAEEMKKTASVCRELAGLFTPEPLEKEPSDALMQWTAQAAYGICAECPMRVLCWRDAGEAAKALYAVLCAHERGERLKIRKPFDPACRHMPQMASAAWQAQNQYLVQRALKHETRQQYAFVNRQLLGICDVIHNLSASVAEDRWLDEALEKQLVNGLDRRGIQALGADALYPNAHLMVYLRLPLRYLAETETVLAACGEILRRDMRLIATHTDGRSGIWMLEEASELAAECASARLPLEEGGVCGDSTGERRLARGKVLFALSDGMGAGERARVESESAIRMLFDLVGAGLDRDTALMSVNKLLLGRKTDMYATLDAVSIDLESGRAEFIKYGAPPTFICRGRNVHQVKAEALPAGILPDAVPAVSRATLKKGDTVVLCSDGALDALGENTVKSISQAVAKQAPPRETAKAILKDARALGQEDDMTVMVIRIA